MSARVGTPLTMPHIAFCRYLCMMMAAVIADGEKTITEMANDYKVSRTYISQMLNLTMLAPDIHHFAILIMESNVILCI